MNKIAGLLIGLIVMSSLSSEAQMVIDNTLTPTQLVEDVLLGQGVTVSNITYTGGTEQIGYFNAANANFPIEEGIVMSSGDVTDVPGAGGTFASTGVGGAGDADLDVVSSAGTNDAVILEFDFVPTGDSIKFDYIFGYEEYPEFVNAGFNDVFVFIISGPGFAGPFANGGENIALIPGTATPVTIDNVNDGLNAQYYVDNSGGGADGIVYDGYTVTLTALAEVVCGETYHLKFAIADAGDAIYDSGVFLEARSFNSNAIEVNITTLSGDSAIVEDCTSALIDFTRPNADSLLAVPVYISGNAINGVDYTGLPDTLYFNPGDSVVTITVTALEDGVFEPIKDTLIITVYSLNLCGDTIVSTGTIYIQEDYNLSIETSDLNVTCPTDSVMLVATAGGGNPDYVYTWNNGAQGDTIWVPVGTTMDYYVNSEDICGAVSLEDTVTVNVNIPDDPIVDVSGPLTFDCAGESALLSASGTLGTTPYTYVWSNGNTGASNSVTLNSDTVFYVSILDGCGVLSVADTIYITQNEVAIPVIQTSPDVVLNCPGDDASLTAIATGANAPYDYIWSTGQTTSTITVQPTQTTDYVVSVTDNCFTEVVQDTITVTVLPYTPPSISVTDTSVICPGDLVSLFTSVENGLPPYSYSWTDGSSGATNNVNPGVSTEILVTVTDGCGSTAIDTAEIDVPVYDALFSTVLSLDLLDGDTITICELWSDTAWTIASGGLPPYSYTWTGTLIDGMYVNNDTAIVSVPYELNPDSTVTETYLINVVDQCGEEVTEEVIVEVISCDIIQPSIFNPGSDFTGSTDLCGNVPQNNVFNLACLDLYPGNEVTIWDRWGRKVYKTENYHLTPWDGGNQSTGVFFYVCELPGDKEPVKGYFHLVR